VAAERGVAGTSHRLIAARAGLPAATTTYFFSSIDELIGEAVTLALRERIADMEEMAAAIDPTTLTLEVIIESIVITLLSVEEHLEDAQLDIYVSAARMPSLRPHVANILDAFERLAEKALVAADIPDAAIGAQAFVALADGFLLHRRARPRGEADREALAVGVRALLAGLAMGSGRIEAAEPELVV
jgi:TetR/AcrR family transcriptional regulator, regulator of biofilm formation and stress response